MGDATAVWKKGLSFTGSGAASGFSLPMGADSKAGGDNDGFRPSELVLVGLAGCTGMDVISILAKKRQQVTAFEVKVHGDTAPNEPKRFTRFVVEYIVTGREVDPAMVERAVELSETKYCTVMNTLRPGAPIERKITVLEG
ncbi:MAG TPA: OsmC family protein [Spirochaetia bacterium]|nr:OsmC family protein [Spirochaetia bacterium]